MTITVNYSIVLSDRAIWGTVDLEEIKLVDYARMVICRMHKSILDDNRLDPSYLSVYKVNRSSSPSNPANI